MLCGRARSLPWKLYRQNIYTRTKVDISTTNDVEFRTAVNLTSVFSRKTQFPSWCIVWTCRRGMNHSSTCSPTFSSSPFQKCLSALSPLTWGGWWRSSATASTKIDRRLLVWTVLPRGLPGAGSVGNAAAVVVLPVYNNLVPSLVQESEFGGVRRGSTMTSHPHGCTELDVRRCICKCVILRSSSPS